MSTLYTDFKDMIKLRFEQRYGCSINLYDAESTETLFNELVECLEKEGYEPKDVLHYVDWFYGFKNTHKTSSLGLLFGIPSKDSINTGLTLEVIVGQFTEWYWRNRWQFKDDDDCFELAFKIRRLIESMRLINQMGEALPLGIDFSSPIDKQPNR